MSPTRHARGVLDTSTLIRLTDVSDPSALPDEPLITAVTLAELSAGPLVAGDERERELRQAHLQLAEASFAPLPFDASAARAFGRVAASLRRSGRKVVARTYDAMIAATAVAHELPIYTANPRDFSGIDDLIVVEVPLSGSTGLPVSRPATTHDFEDVPLHDRPENVLDALGDLRGDR